jgi:uncharacterized membrane protein YgcG
VKEGEQRVAELEEELNRRQSGQGDASEGSNEDTSSSPAASESSSSSDDSNHGSESEQSDQEAETKMDVDENKDGIEDSKGGKQEEDEAEKEDLRSLDVTELKTRLGLAKHHLKKAKDDVVYVTFFPIQEHKYISLYPTKDVVDLQLRTKIRRQILAAHNYEEAMLPHQSKKKWGDRPSKHEETRSNGARDSRHSEEQNDRRKDKNDKKEAKKDEKGEEPETPKMNRKQRRAAAADAASKVEYGLPEAASDDDGDNFFFDTQEAAEAAAVETKRLRKEKLDANNAAQKAASEAKKTAAKDLAQERARKGGFQVPDDDVITSADFFGDDFAQTGRMADPAWEAQQSRSQKTGDRTYRFMPNAPEYLTSRGKKRAMSSTPEDGFTKKPWEANKETEFNSNKTHQFSGRGGRGGRGGFRGGRGGFRGGGRGGSFGARNSGPSRHEEKKSFKEKMAEAPAKAPIDPSAPQKKVRSRPKGKKRDE